MNSHQAEDLTIIIVNWNVLAYLRACLASIYREASEPGAPALSVVVVDNASAENPAPILSQEFPQVHWLLNPQNLGFAQACNQGISPSQGRYILLLNPDTEVRPGALAQLIACLDAHPRAGAVGPLIRTPAGQVDYLGGRRFPTPWSQALDWAGITRRWPRLAAHLLPAWNHRISRAVPCLSGACLALRREALDAVGLLDTSYFLYVEDMDLCYRLARAGWEIRYCAEAEIVHWGSQSSQQVKTASMLRALSAHDTFFRKFYNGRAVFLHHALILLVALTKMAFYALAAAVFPSAERRRHFQMEARAQALLARWAMGSRQS